LTHINAASECPPGSPGEQEKIMIHRCDPTAGWPHLALWPPLIRLVVSLGALAAMEVNAQSVPQWTVAASPSTLFSESYSPYTDTVSIVANVSLLPGAIILMNSTNSAGTNPGNVNWNG
jgi:hypothetical protein